MVALRIDRGVYFSFRALARAHRLSVEGATEALMREALQRTGIQPAETDEQVTPAATREPRAAVKVE
jgi:hypothetical protein